MNKHRVMIGLAFTAIIALWGCKDSDVSSTIDTKTFKCEKDMDTSYQPGDILYVL